MPYGLFHLVPPDFTLKTVLSAPNRGYSWLDPGPKLPDPKVYISPALDLDSIVVASSTAAEDTVQRRNDIKAAGQLACKRWQKWKEAHQPLQVAFDSTEYGNDGIPKMAGCDFVPFPTVQTPDSSR
jgi:hypothetical protein